ncbi:SDR family oxidoreductase [Pseudonocardia endophytica]|uniref:3alpha(Or 20beta)-hydroxysteroid dehydrogenase n=1 Tax=Pseudonocardia endophytica TaxID=401976 RepID=A0A4R1HNU9_PSEEN|nr:SDR family oxidoreductase [Pseudonocardia endophytica]TCK22060.1 3alpha(or 20beta)-hydroxysteroid dehydrogenase [Pseudonocardia endophytica]
MSVFADDALAARIVLVSGAARGMGAEHAAAVVAAGGRVVVGDVDGEGVRAVAKELGTSALAVDLDVTEPDDWSAAVRAGEEAFGPFTGLVTNAGIFGDGGTADVGLEAFRQVHRVNVEGTLLGIQAVTPSLVAAGGGSIVTISSVAGLIGIGDHAAYVSSKFAVRGLTKAAALDLGPHGIRVNSVHPGRISTSFIEGLGSPVLPNQIVREPGLPHDVSELVVFLLSPASRFSTGSEFVVDGGRYVGEYRP